MNRKLLSRGLFVLGAAILLTVLATGLSQAPRADAGGFKACPQPP